MPLQLLCRVFGHSDKADKPSRALPTQEGQTAEGLPGVSSVPPRTPGMASVSW